MRPDEFVARLAAERASAILRCPSEADARVAMEAAIAGGFRVCEFTLTIPGAVGLIREFASRGDLVVGAGTVLTVDDARAAVDAGARFLVSPVFDPLVVEEAQRLGVASIPGCATPTEMLAAHRAGATLLKLFPAQPPSWIAQTLGPMPFLRIVPTSGVTLENCHEHLAAGAFAVGFVNSLFVPSEVASQDAEAIEARARLMLAAVRQ
jgi:Entner-Doudoroff aldolase